MIRNPFLRCSASLLVIAAPGLVALNSSSARAASPHRWLLDDGGSRLSGFVIAQESKQSGGESSAASAVVFDPEELPDIEGNGWTSLFSGDSLQGWTQKNGYGTYRVEDRTIVGKTAEGSPNSFLCTDHEYEDFELTFEVKIDKGLNSGVQIRSGTKPDNDRVFGPQVEIESAPGEAGYLYSEATGRSWLTAEQPIKDAFENEAWNRYVIRANGDRIQTWVNGRAIVDLRDAEARRKGFVGLQVHGIEKGSGPFEVRWRDLRIRELK